MRRLLDDERGMVAVLSAILATVLFGFLALVIDVGLIYGERRGLQRTADSAALAGGQMIATGDAALMESTAIDYINSNPTMGHEEFDFGNDTVDALPLGSGGCLFEGSAYDCVDIEVKTPELELFFAPMLGVNTAEVSARSRAILGSGAPGGDKLVPWALLDCPDAYGEGRGFTDEQSPAVAAAFAAANPGIVCPYTFSDDYNSGQQALFLDIGSGGNFGAADLSVEPDCDDQAVSGYFKSGGGPDYRSILEGEGGPEIPCHIGGGARFHSKTGQMTGQTDQGLGGRNVASCMDPASFNEAVDVGAIGDGVVTIKETNPCLVALIFAVHSKGTEAMGPGCEAAHLKEAFYAGRIREMQSDEVLGDVASGDCNSDLWRFAPLIPEKGPDGAGGGTQGGVGPVLVVRRHAFFYITQHNTGNSRSGNPKVAGLFLRAIDSRDAILTGPYDPATGISILRLVPPE